MKKNIRFIPTLTLALLLCGCAAKETTPPPATIAPIPTAASTASTPAPTPTQAPAVTPEPASEGKTISPEVQALTAQNEKVWEELRQRQYMEGRLVIPSVGIDVALFNWGTNPNGSSDPDKDVEAVRQAVVDNPDSALLYYDPPVGNIIADHSTQDFGALVNVKEGDAAYILSGDRILSLRCDMVTDGVNTGYGITDKDGGWHHEEDYTCYTCLEDWTHIKLVGFTMTDEDFFDMDAPAQGSSGSSAASSSGSSSNSNNVAGAVATTVSLPAPAATQTPAPSATPAPAAATPTPTAAAQPAPQQNPPAQNVGGGQPVINYEPAPSYDAYSDGGYRGDTVYVNGNANGDGYLS